MKGFKLVKKETLNKKDFAELHKEMELLRQASTKDNRPLIRDEVRDRKNQLFHTKYDIYFYDKKIGYTSNYDLSIKKKLDYIQNHIDKVKSERRRSKEKYISTKYIDGFKVLMCGGLPIEKPSEIKRSHTPRDVSEPKFPKTPHNYVGVEIELCSSISRDQMVQLICDKKLSHKVKIVSDSSIASDSSTTPYTFEVTIMDREETIKSTLIKLGEIFKDSNYVFKVNKTCGTHVHLDMRNRNVEECYRKLVDNQEKIYGASDVARKKNHYCYPNVTNKFKSAFNDYGSNRGPRYQAINPEAYDKHKTLEVRAFAGCLDTDKIYSWIEMLLSFINSNEVEVKSV